MTKLESIVVSNTEPNSKNVLWYDNKRLLIFSNGHWSPIVDLDDIDVDNLPNVSNLQEALKSLNIKVDNKVDKVEGKGLSTNDYTDNEKSKLSTLPTATELDAALTAKQDKLVNSADVTVREDDKLTVTDLAKKKVFIDQWESLAKLYNNALISSYDAATDKFNLKWEYTDEYAKKYMPSVTYKQAMTMVAGIQNSLLGYGSFSFDAPANLPPIGYQYGSGPYLSIARSEVCLHNPAIQVLIFAVQENGVATIYDNPVRLTALTNLKAVIGVFITDIAKNPIEFVAPYGTGFPKLEFFRAQIKQSFDVSTSPLLTLDTMQYLVTNAKNTTPITVTVHPDVYAKLTGDTTNSAAAALTASELAAWKQVVTDAAAKKISFATI